MPYGLAPRGGPVQITPLLSARGLVGRGLWGKTAMARQLCSGNKGDAELRCISGGAGCNVRKGSSPTVGPATKAPLAITGL